MEEKGLDWLLRALATYATRVSRDPERILGTRMRIARHTEGFAVKWRIAAEDICGDGEQKAGEDREVDGS